MKYVLIYVVISIMMSTAFAIHDHRWEWRVALLWPWIIVAWVYLGFFGLIGWWKAGKSPDRREGP